MGGRKLKEGSKGLKLFDWGRGLVPIGWAMFVVGLLLLSNSAGLLLSQSFVFDGVPRDYVSSLEGSIDLPFILAKNSAVFYQGPEEVLTSDPFNVVFKFHEGRIPSIPYAVEIIGENGIYASNLLQMRDVAGNLSIGTRIPGLKEPGTYEIRIGPDLTGREELTDITPRVIWQLTVLENAHTHPIPILYKNLAFSSPLSSFYPNDQLIFEVGGLEGQNISEYHIDTENGKSSLLEDLGGQRWKLVDPDIIGKGWTVFQLVRSNGSEQQMRWDYITCDPMYPILHDSEVIASVQRSFRGEDELFDQEEDGSLDISFDEELELYEDQYYLIDLEIKDGSGSSGVSVLMNGSEFFQPTVIQIGTGSYSLQITDAGTYKGIFRTPAAQEKDLELSLNVGYPNLGKAVFTSDIRLREDHSPAVDIKPDIFRIGTYQDGGQDGFELVLSAEWEKFNRKDFIGMPNVTLDGVVVLPDVEHDELSEHDLSYQFERDLLLSGGSLNLTSVNSLEFASWIAFLLPIPSIFIVIPFPITGWVAVAWFVMVTAACLFSVFFLFYRTLKPLWKKDPNASGSKKVRELLSSESDLALTSKTYLGALFFFFAIYWMLQLFDQPTPVPGILSSETPIWIRMFLLADASVWEEISGRVVLIGIPMFIYHSVQDRNGIQWKQLVGGTGKFGGGEMLVILVSAGLFGLAHLGWGPWKVIPTFVHGLLFGYLFIKVGLHASIAMHFLFDYTSFLNEITGICEPTFLMVIITSLTLGGLFLGDWVSRCQRWFSFTLLKRTPRPVFQLMVHSILSMSLGSFILFNGGSIIIAILFFSVPIVDLIGFTLWKKTRSDLVAVSWIIRGIVFLWSFLAWAAAPFGHAWAVDPGPSEKDQGL